MVPCRGHLDAGTTGVDICTVIESGSRDLTEEIKILCRRTVEPEGAGRGERLILNSDVLEEGWYRRSRVRETKGGIAEWLELELVL